MWGRAEWCCCLSYKDTILKANHSISIIGGICISAVAYPTKILFWKRITALINPDWFYLWLLLILQRYYFESESQLLVSPAFTVPSCCLSYKDTILKANHSIQEYHSLLKQLLLILQRYYFESESQHTERHPRPRCAVAYPTKILFWKRITADYSWCIIYCQLLLILQRYYFESESQLAFLEIFLVCSCCLSYKDTILKANHSITALAEL